MPIFTTSGKWDSLENPSSGLSLFFFTGSDPIAMQYAYFIAPGGFTIVESARDEGSSVLITLNFLLKKMTFYDQSICSRDCISKDIL